MTECQHNAFHVGNRVTLIGLEDLVFAAISSYPIGNISAEILKEGNKYFFLPMRSIPLHARAQSLSPSCDHAGYLHSKHLKSMFDYEFEKRLQPSITDLREMYELRESIRAFIVTNGAGWAFRLFDFHNVSLAELNWLEFGFAKAMRNVKDVEFYLACLPKRMALSLLQNDQSMVQFLANELETVGTEVNRLQESYGAQPSKLISELLSLAASVVILGETFLHKNELQSDAIFETHVVDAFKAVIQGDSKLAFSEALKFSLPSVQALSGTGKGDTKLAKIAEINSRLNELRLPTAQHAIRLNTLIDFLKRVNEQARSLMLECYAKLRTYKRQPRESEDAPRNIPDNGSQDQSADTSAHELNGLSEFMCEAIRSYPNRVIGQVRRNTDQCDHYAITDVKVVPCDIVIRYFPPTDVKKGLAESPGAQPVVGRAASKSCVRDDEMIAYLHPRTLALNEMLRFRYSLNAIAVSNGKKCIFRLHNGSNDTILVARMPQTSN